MGRRLALLIVTYEHRDSGLRQLTAPAHDAEALAEVLCDPRIAGFEVTTLVNEPCHVVGEAIGDFYRGRRRDDLTLLYFTGHGLKDDSGRLYLAMTDTRRDSLLFTALSAEQLDQAMEGCASRQKVLVLDCCYSGAFPAGRLSKADTSVHALERLRGRGRTVLTASDATQYSFEGDRAHGRAVQSVFTRHLVQGLRDGSADLDGDGDITLDELYSYVHDRVVDEMPQQRPKKQDDVEGRTVIARNVNWTLPSYLRNALASPIAGDRLGALDGLTHLHRIGNEDVRAAVLEEIRRLAEDDSRLVSTAAAERLRGLVPQRPSAEEVLPGPEVVGPGAMEPTPVKATAVRPMPVEPVPVEPTPVEPTPVQATAVRPTPVEPMPAEPTPVRTAPVHAAPISPAPPAPPLPSVRPPAPRTRTSRLVPRTRRSVTLTLAATLLLLTTAVTVPLLLTRDHAHHSTASASSAPLSPTATLPGAGTQLAFSPDGKILATDGGKGVRLWRGGTGQSAGGVPGQGFGGFGPDGKTLATVDTTPASGATVNLRNLDTGAVTALRTGHPASVTLAFSPDGKTLATASGLAADSAHRFDSAVRLWDTATGKTRTVLSGHTNGVESMAFSADSRTLATGSVDHTVRLWDVRTGEKTATLTGGDQVFVYMIALSPAAKTAATWGGTDAVRLWNTATGKVVATLPGAHSTAAFSPDGKALALADDTSARLLDPATGSTLTTLTGAARPLRYSPDGKTLATGDAGDQAVLLWNTATGQRYYALPGPATALALDPTGTVLAVADKDGTVRLWRTPTP